MIKFHLMQQQIIYQYTLAEYDYAWNKPAWDAKFGIEI